MWGFSEPVCNLVIVATVVLGRFTVANGHGGEGAGGVILCKRGVALVTGRCDWRANKLVRSVTNMTSPQGLVEQILPARGAAQKASASFAEQLADSPGRSDGDSPAPANPFHEPVHRTKAVKYRYTATGKHLSSPLKGSSSSPERKQVKSKRKLMATSPSHATAKAPGVASTSRKRKASFLPSHEELLRSSFLSSPSPLSSAPTSPLVPKKDLSPSPALTAKELAPDPPKRISISKTLSLRAFGPTASKASVLSQPLSPKRKQKKKYKADTKKDLDVWAIGNSVWVLINQSGVIADSTTKVDPSGEVMWWPAQVCCNVAHFDKCSIYVSQVVQKQPIRVSLFGDFPSSSSTSRGLCTIFAPSSSNVLPINDDSGVKRFSRATFRLIPSSVDDDVSPPTKKPRLDETASMETRWESAVQSMDKASTLEQDGLPTLLSSYAATGGYDSLDDSDSDTPDLRQPLRKPTTPRESALSASAKKSKPRRSKVDTSGTAPREMSLCHPDPTLQIPGELVLALAPRTGNAYWPAQILMHVPAPKEKYRIKFLDDEEYVVSRDRFWTSEEEGFVLCTLGEWESPVKASDDVDSSDEGGEYGAEDGADVTGLDDAICPLAPPPRAEAFADLPVRAQLAYVKPVLQAILTKEYEPVRGNHEAFMRGGSARLALMKSAGVRGRMDARFVKAIQKAICEWVLGAGGLKPQKLDTGNEAIKTDGAEEGATPKAISSESNETLPHDSTEDGKMEGIEGAVAEDVQTHKNNGPQNGTLDLSMPDKHVEGDQDIEMAADMQEEVTSTSAVLFIPT